MKNEFRCGCPITSALDIVGDKWTLVIIKQMLLENIQTFKEFSEMEESIATNILSARLKMLEKFKVITKEKLPNNKKINIYRLTEKGISLAPVILELGLWSDSNVREFNAEIRSQMDAIKNNKEAFIKNIQDGYRERMGGNKG